MVARTDRLVAAARRARKRAYCPYSRFAVGAAVETNDGRIFAGCNIENASYGLTICAERAAIFAAVCAGGRRMLRLAVSCGNNPALDANSLMPCGACRQVMREFMDAGAEVIVDGSGTFTLDTLLPRAFCLTPKPRQRTRRVKT